MTASKTNDRRCAERISCKIPIPVHISYLNSEQPINAQLVDHCTNGVCFISDQAFFLGTPIIFRVAYCAFDGSGGSELERLPNARLGEVRWCKKLPDDSSASYGVGVKYYPQIY